MGALVFGGVRAGIRWYVAFLAVFLGCGLAGEILGTVSPLPAWFTTVMLALNIAVGGTIVFTLLALFAKQREDALAALRVAQDQAESLLLNVLPRPIAERLKAEPQTIADQFTSASILFADVVDFTRRSEKLPPAEVVGILDHLFSHFDMLAERYALEKIKTIGDCYMVAAGVPSPRPDHARALALMALDMVEAMRSSDGSATSGWSCAIGINSGPVVAGVIGRKRFLYDLWGDAVNTASRMESQGTPGRIQITRATYDLIRDEFVCEPRGTISVKGKGDMETWYLLGRRPFAAMGRNGRRDRLARNSPLGDRPGVTRAASRAALTTPWSTPRASLPGGAAISGSGTSVTGHAMAIAIVMIVALVIGFRPTTGPVEWVAAAGVLALAALAIVVLGRPRHVAAGRRDREQPADLPGPALPEQRFCPDEQRRHGSAESPRTSPSRRSIQQRRDFLVDTLRIRNSKSSNNPAAYC